MQAKAPTVDTSSQFFISTLCHLWSAKGWETGCHDSRPHERMLVDPALWMRPPGRDDVALVLLMHGTDEAEQARQDVALTAASAVEGSPRWVGCVHVFDVRDGSSELGKVARLGHAMACEMGSFIYHASAWQSAEQMVELARAVEDTADRLATMAGLR